MQIDYERVFSQVKINTNLKRLEWQPNKLKDNIYEVIGIITKLRDLQMKGSPYLINGTPKSYNRVYAWDFEYKCNPSRRKGE